MSATNTMAPGLGSAASHHNPLEGMSKKQRLAAFLVVLGSEGSVSILNEIDEKEVEEISKEMAKIEFIPVAMQKALMKEFSDVTYEAVTSARGGAQYTRQVLEKAIGSYKANEVINRVAPTTPHFVDADVLRGVPPRQLVNLLRKEQTQTWSLVLSYLEPQQCSEVLNLVTAEMRADIVERIATMEPTPAEVVEKVLMQIRHRAALQMKQDVALSGGTKILAEVLNLMDDASSKQVLTILEERNPDLARTIKKLLFTFEDMVNLDKNALSKLLREVDYHILAVAMKTASEKLKGLIMGSLTKRAADMINEEIQFMPPIKLKEVEEAQEQIIEILRRLEASGEVTIKSGGGDGDAVV